MQHYLLCLKSYLGDRVSNVYIQKNIVTFQNQPNLYSYWHCLGPPVTLKILNRILNQNQLDCLEPCKNRKITKIEIILRNWEPCFCRICWLSIFRCDRNRYKYFLSIIWKILSHNIENVPLIVFTLSTPNDTLFR